MTPGKDNGKKTKTPYLWKITIFWWLSVPHCLFTSSPVKASISNHASRHTLGQSASSQNPITRQFIIVSWNTRPGFSSFHKCTCHLQFWFFFSSKGRTTQSGFIIYHLSTVNEVGASLHPIDHNKPEGRILLSNDNILFLCCPGILINKERNLRWTVIIFAVISPFFLRWQPPLLT